MVWMHVNEGDSTHVLWSLFIRSVFRSRRSDGHMIFGFIIISAVLIAKRGITEREWPSCVINTDEQTVKSTAILQFIRTEISGWNSSFSLSVRFVSGSINMIFVCLFVSKRVRYGDSLACRSFIKKLIIVLLISYLYVSTNQHIQSTYHCCLVCL